MAKNTDFGQFYKKIQKMYVFGHTFFIFQISSNEMTEDADHFHSLKMFINSDTSADGMKLAPVAVVFELLNFCIFELTYP